MFVASRLNRRDSSFSLPRPPSPRPRPCPAPTRTAGVCTGGATRRTTGPPAGCRRRVRPAVHALYAYVRRRRRPRRRVTAARGRRPSAGTPSTPGRRRSRAPGERGTSPHPEVAALGRRRPERHELDLAPLEAYMCSMRIDCDRVRIASWAELEAYMEGSAGSVGRILAPLLGAPAEADADAFSRLGPRLPARELPARRPRGPRARPRSTSRAEDLERCGVPRGGPRPRIAPRPSSGPRVGTPRSAARAPSSPPATRPRRAAPPRRPLGHAPAPAPLYEAVLDRIERTGFDVLGSRTTPSPWHLGLAAAGALRPAP